MPKYKYNIGVQILEGLEDGNRKVISERMLDSYDELNDAVDNLLKKVYSSDYLANVTKDEVLDCIQEDNSYLFNKGKPYRVLLDDVQYSENNVIHRGPGAYTIEKTSLQ